MPSPHDICHCGDARRDHKNGTGACIFNEPGRFDLCHGGEDCVEFRLHEKAPGLYVHPSRLKRAKKMHDGPVYADAELCSPDDWYVVSPLTV